MIRIANISIYFVINTVPIAVKLKTIKDVKLLVYCKHNVLYLCSAKTIYFGWLMLFVNIKGPKYIYTSRLFTMHKCCTRSSQYCQWCNEFQLRGKRVLFDQRSVMLSMGIICFLFGLAKWNNKNLLLSACLCSVICKATSLFSQPLVSATVSPTWCLIGVTTWQSLHFEHQQPTHFCNLWLGCSVANS